MTGKKVSFSNSDNARLGRWPSYVGPNYAKVAATKERQLKEAGFTWDEIVHDKKYETVDIIGVRPVNVPDGYKPSDDE